VVGIAAGESTAVTYWLNCCRLVSAMGILILSISSARRLPLWNTYVGVECVAVEIPRAKKLHLLASTLGPGVAVDKRRVKSEHCNAKQQESGHQGFANSGPRSETKALDAIGDKVELLAKNQDGEVQRRQVVVQEELPSHEVEREVVEGPTQDVGADFVVETFEGDVSIVIAASLPTEDRDTLEDNVDSNGQGGSPPDERVAQEVNLTVVRTPKVDTTEKSWPGRRSRIPSV